MKTRKNANKRLEEEISNAVDPPYGKRVRPLEEGDNMDQAQVNPPPFIQIA